MRVMNSGCVIRCELRLTIPSPLCVRCHSLVGLVLCLCDRVVSLWNSGGDLSGAEGARGVCCSLSTLYVWWCVLSCCAVLWAVKWRWVVRV